MVFKECCRCGDALGARGGGARMVSIELIGLEEVPGMEGLSACCSPLVPSLMLADALCAPCLAGLEAAVAAYISEGKEKSYVALDGPDTGQEQDTVRAP